MEKPTNQFLKYRSKSEKSYYELTDLFNLKPLDVLVMQYLMKMFRKSVDHGKSGKHGKCFYRHDKKITGFYYAGHYKDMAKHIHAKTTEQSVKNSVKRLQAKGLLFRHKSINNVQIFFPIFDEDVRESFDDPDYKTVINFNEIRKAKNLSHASTKINFAQDKKLALRKIKNLSCNNVPLINKPLINKPKTNVVVVSPLKRGSTTNNDNRQQQPKAKQKLPKWINSNLNQSIANLLVNNTKDVKSIATKIIDTIFSTNRKYMNIMSSTYYKNQNNPYIQNGGLMNSLKTVFKNHKDLKDTITNDYQNYISDNSNLKLKNSEKSKDNGLAYNGNDKSTDDKITEAENKIDLLNKGKKHAETKDEKRKIQDQIQKQAQFICNNSDDEMWAINGTIESKPKLHPTSKAMQKKVKRELKDLDQHDNEPYIDAKGEEHVTVHHEVFQPKSKPNTIDMNELETEFEKEDNSNETVPPSKDVSNPF